MTNNLIKSDKKCLLLSCCDRVDREATIDPGFLLLKCSHWHFFRMNTFTVDCIENTKIKKKVAGNMTTQVALVMGPWLLLKKESADCKD